jgi:predicted Zn-dependent protease
MDKRLNHYQTFETRKDGLAKYGELFNLAFQNKDYKEMLTSLLRTLELQESPLSPTGLQCYKQIAILLFRMGHEEAGDKAMQNCVDLFESTDTPVAYQAAMEAFMIYAFSCKNAKKALEVAEELLKNKPDHILALTVKMVAKAEANRLTEAKQIAERLIKLDKNEQSPSYRTAIQILARNEQQDSGKEP